jgi:ubiquinone/menaquinone biosynthesis C-methylase UbiE
MNPGTRQFREQILSMRRAYLGGENAMEAGRRSRSEETNSTNTTLVAYDLQAGSYVENAISNPEANSRWCRQLSDLLEPYLRSGDSLLEVGAGEATTLCGVRNNLSVEILDIFGFDISWSRCHVGSQWLRKCGKTDARLFVADLFAIPFANDSIDVVYTSHSIEPNGGREREAIQEILRVARKAVILVEPLFELASPEARKRMESHGYVRGLKETVESLGGRVTDFRLLEHCANPLNPSGCVIIEKDRHAKHSRPEWQCPLTGAPMIEAHDLFHAEECGVVYPILRGIPILRPEHAVIASKIS